MAWFKRKTKGIQTSTEEKKDTPEGLWHKTPTGKIIDTEELENNSFVSPEDGFHIRIGSQEYFNILFVSFSLKPSPSSTTFKFIVPFAFLYSSTFIS